MSVPLDLFVLDTTVVSELTKPSPDALVAEWLEGAPAGALCIPSSVVFEVQLGVELARRRGNSRAEEFERHLDRILGDARFRVLPPSVPAARIRARMAAEPALRHFTERDPRSLRAAAGEHLAIAATAVAAGAVIVSLNTRVFATIDRHFPLPGILHPGSGSLRPRSGAETPSTQRVLPGHL